MAIEYESYAFYHLLRQRFLQLPSQILDEDTFSDKDVNGSLYASVRAKNFFKFFDNLNLKIEFIYLLDACALNPKARLQSKRGQVVNLILRPQRLIM